MFLAGGGQVKVLDSGGNELGQFDVNASNFAPCGLTRQGDTVYVCYLNRISALACIMHEALRRPRVAMKGGW